MTRFPDGFKYLVDAMSKQAISAEDAIIKIRTGDWARNHDPSSSRFDIDNLDDSEAKAIIESEIKKKQRANMMIGLALAGTGAGFVGGKVLSDKFFTAPKMGPVGKSRIPLITIPASMLAGGGLGALLGNKLSS